MPTTDISANGLVINKLSKAQYDAIQNPSDTELYLVPDEIDNAPTSGSNNPVKSGGVYSALGNKQDNLVFNTAYNATTNKVATMADISNFVQKSSTSGLIKNDGTIDTNSYLTSHQDISNYIQKSSTSGLIRNDGTIDTTAYTTNTGTITGITMNGSSKGTSGVVDLGTVITDVSGKANDSEVVHNTGTEQISGQKSFNNRVNFLGTGDANAIYLTTDTRIDVNGTSYTILGFASGTFLINHTNYNLKLRGKGTRPAYNTDTNYIALLSDVPEKLSDLTDDLGNSPTHTHSQYLTSHQDISGKADKVTSATNGNFASLDSNGNLTDSGHKHSDYLTSFTETDPVFSASAAHGITSSDITSWNGRSAQSIPFGVVDSTSVATEFTATVDGITELRDGTCVLLKNGVVTSAAGFTININNLGAHPAFNNMTAATAETTIFNINYTMLFVYDSTRVVDGYTGAWCCYRGYDNNTNTIGYQLRSNSYSKAMAAKTYRYRILFSSADNSEWVPANTSSSTNATASRAVCQTPINPFGEIVYYGTTATVAADSRPAAANLWQEYTLALGYSFNNTGAALTLTSWKPVYVKCAPRADGSAIIDSTTPYVQSLPSTDDGKIYIFLGVAYSATNIELLMNHPVFYYKDGAIRQWSNTYIPDISGKESTANKVTSLSSSSTDTEYPSAKCVWDMVGDIETLLAAI